MSRKPPVCLDLEPDLVAAATGEAGAAAAERVRAHVARCAPCRDEYAGYRAVDREVATLRAVPDDDAASAAARERLLARLADVRSRLVRYTVFDTPLGPVLVARSEQGVSLVEYLGASGVAGSTLARLVDVEIVEDEANLAGLREELLTYLAGRRTRLDWPLDLGLVRSEFQREVLRATAALPYGAVTSYAGIAGQLGHPRSVRAVAQALRRNPVPIVIPCHRVVGSDGQLVGYAGNRVGLKEHLLAVEGVHTERGNRPRVARRALYHYEENDAREYCVPTCGDIARRSLGRIVLFARRDEAEARGLVPCTSCRPDLHPLR